MSKVLLLHFYDDGDGLAVGVIGTFDDLAAANDYVSQLVHPTTGHKMFDRHEVIYNDHFWNRDAGDYIQAVFVENNPAVSQFSTNPFSPGDIFTPRGWQVITPCPGVNDEEDE